MQGLGLDIITCPGPPFTLTAANAQFLVSAAGLVLIQTAKRDFTSAQCTVDMMLAVLSKTFYAQAENHSSPDAMEVDLEKLLGDETVVPTCIVRKGWHSFRSEHQRLAVSAEGVQGAEFKGILRAMSHLFSCIMLGRPEEAMRVLTTVSHRLPKETQL